MRAATFALASCVLLGCERTRTSAGSGAGGNWIDNPVPNDATEWVIEGAFAPSTARSWSDPSNPAPRLWAFGDEGKPNSASLVAIGNKNDLRVEVYDANGELKSFTVQHAFAPGSEHTIAVVNAKGTLRVFIDGARPQGPSLAGRSLMPVTETAAGAGLGIVGAMPARIYGGSSPDGGNRWPGYVRWLRAYTGKSVETTAPQRIEMLWIGESIHNDTGGTYMRGPVSSGLAPSPVRHHAGTYGGTTIGTGLMELADSTDAFEGGAWTPKERGWEFAEFGAMVIQYLRNDANNGEPLLAMRKAFDKLVSQGTRLTSARLITATAPPKALSDLSAWDASHDAAIIGGYRAAIDAVAAAWNTNHVDTFDLFMALADGTYAVSTLMRDVWHPTYTTGMGYIATRIVDAYNENRVQADPGPEIGGRVVNHLFGVPAGGTWTYATAGLVSSTGPFQSPLYRIAGLPDAASVSSVAGSVLKFPDFESTDGGQVWAHFLVDSRDGGAVSVRVDAGQPAERSATVNTLQSGVLVYPRSALIASELPAGVHTLEMETLSAAPVRVMGVTYVGVRGPGDVPAGAIPTASTTRRPRPPLLR